MSRVLRDVLRAVAVCVLLAGCGVLGSSPTDQEGGRVMDMQEAAERADSILDGTFVAIRPEVRWTHGETTVGSCDLSRRRAVMTVISEQRRGGFLGVVERFWQKSGYEITSVNSSEEFPAIYAKSADGFGLRLSVAGKGQAFFEVATPCVEESAVADPTSQPNGPDYSGSPIPRPDVHDDFWSSRAPLPTSSSSAS
ncbi:hypothetical protein ACFXBB_19125 [Streptomyces scopuliridis]|uniref:hypothetical protein n=1 Tax=Streptomyces scopuliridis TaxID=452529 RepID=UPI0036C8B869